MILFTFLKINDEINLTSFPTINYLNRYIYFFKCVWVFCLKNALQGHTEEIVCKTAVRIVTCQRSVTERLVHVMAVVKRDGNLLCVMKVFLVPLFVYAILFWNKYIFWFKIKCDNFRLKHSILPWKYRLIWSGVVSVWVRSQELWRVWPKKIFLFHLETKRTWENFYWKLILRSAIQVSYMGKSLRWTKMNCHIHY